MVQITINLAPDVLAALDQVRGETARASYVSQMLHAQLTEKGYTLSQPRGKGRPMRDTNISRDDELAIGYMAGIVSYKWESFPTLYRATGGKLVCLEQWEEGDHDNRLYIVRASGYTVREVGQLLDKAGFEGGGDERRWQGKTRPTSQMFVEWGFKPLAANRAYEVYNRFFLALQASIFRREVINLVDERIRRQHDLDDKANRPRKVYSDNDMDVLYQSAVKILVRDDGSQSQVDDLKISLQARFLSSIVFDAIEQDDIPYTRGWSTPYFALKSNGGLLPEGCAEWKIVKAAIAAGEDKGEYYVVNPNSMVSED